MENDYIGIRDDMLDVPKGSLVRYSMFADSNPVVEITAIDDIFAIFHRSLVTACVKRWQVCIPSCRIHGDHLGNFQCV